MLKVFRDNLKYLSWVLWLVILVFVLFIFVDFGSINLGGGPAAPGSAAAVVGNAEVSYTAFERAYLATMKTCNSCHTSAGHGFIRIGLPERKPVANRIYEPAIATD